MTEPTIGDRILTSLSQQIGALSVQNAQLVAQLQEAQERIAAMQAKEADDDAGIE